MLNYTHPSEMKSKLVMYNSYETKFYTHTKQQLLLQRPWLIYRRNEKSVHIYQTTWRRVPEDSNIRGFSVPYI